MPACFIEVGRQRSSATMSQKLPKQNSRVDFSLHYIFPGVLSTETIIILVLFFLMLMSTGAKTKCIYSPPGAGSTDFFFFLLHYLGS